MKRDNEIIDLDFTRSLGLDNELIHLIIDIYINQVDEFISLLQKYLVSKEWMKLAEIAHKVKGSVTFFGMKELEMLLKKIQLLAQAYRLTDLISKEASNQVLQEMEIKDIGNLCRSSFVADHGYDLFKKFKMSVSEREFYNQAISTYRDAKNINVLNFNADKVITLLKLSQTEITTKKKYLV
ncbi:MAG: Hpt domain-containing protein [Bacteroidia bacterium]|nr:Hpt domain-containing protein [Bacteroidia bacterium]